MRKIINISAGMVVLGMFFLTGTAQGTDQETLIKRIKDNYQELTSFQADIYMVGTQEQGKGISGEGKIWAKEGKFRMEVETITPGAGEEGVIEKQTLVFDGKIFWMYSQPENELITIDLSQLAGLSGSLGGQLQEIVTELEEGAVNFFSPQFPPGKEIEISENEWKGKSFYVLRHEERETWVSKDDYLIYRVITYDEAENVTSDVELTMISLNEKISDELLTFQIPEGAQPLDMVAMMKAMFEAFEEHESD